MNILYINDLRELPNWGCRSTGAALEEMLLQHNTVYRSSGLDTVPWSGWDSFASYPLRCGGYLPARFYKYSWYLRFKDRNFFNKVKLLDSFFGASHDYISSDPEKSVINFKLFLKKDKYLDLFYQKLVASDSIVINGEGTLIFGYPILRDALYLLFIIALAKKEKKPVFLLNAMVSGCPYTGINKNFLKKFFYLFEYCQKIACRDEESIKIISSFASLKNVEFIPDALFAWGSRFVSAYNAIKVEPSIIISYLSDYELRKISFSDSYICVSGSSNSWRHQEKIEKQFTILVKSIKKLGLPVYLVETCDGDSFLWNVAKMTGVTFIPKSTPVIAGGGILAGASLYISGRYHPSIMASSNGVPCIFMSSNSHKTFSLQKILQYSKPVVFSSCPSEDEINKIFISAKKIIFSEKNSREKIKIAFDLNSIFTDKYINIVK